MGEIAIEFEMRETCNYVILRFCFLTLTDRQTMTAVASSSNSAPPLSKYLASTGISTPVFYFWLGLIYISFVEKKTRDKAIKTLSIFLSDESRDEIPKSEMKKLWKGIFYCMYSLPRFWARTSTEKGSLLGFWMSDKPLVQQALASELADLLLTTRNTPSALSFLDGFWEAVVREWNGIDRLRYASQWSWMLSRDWKCNRLDKYLMLVRRFINASFRLLLRNDWDSKTVQDYNTILTNEGWPLWWVSMMSLLAFSLLTRL